MTPFRARRQGHFQSSYEATAGANCIVTSWSRIIYKDNIFRRLEKMFARLYRSMYDSSETPVIKASWARKKCILLS